MITNTVLNERLDWLKVRNWLFCATCLHAFKIKEDKYTLRNGYIDVRFRLRVTDEEEYFTNHCPSWASPVGSRDKSLLKSDEN